MMTDQVAGGRCLDLFDPVGDNSSCGKACLSVTVLGTVPAAKELRRVGLARLFRETSSRTQDRFPGRSVVELNLFIAVAL